jgi:hypothetical protein
MADLEKLLERMRRIEALYSRTDVPGERAAAGNALEAILEQIRRHQQSDPPVEFSFKLGDHWSRRLFMALARRYKLEPYRYRGQRHTTVMLRVPRSFVDKTLWPEFTQLSDLLRTHLDEVTNQVIAQGLGASSSDETVVKDSSGALPAPQER